MAGGMLIHYMFIHYMFTPPFSPLTGFDPFELLARATLHPHKSLRHLLRRSVATYPHMIAASYLAKLQQQQQQ